MNPEIKKRWVDALRSGSYRQGAFALHNQTTDTYCCLGVLCELAVQEGAVPYYMDNGMTLPTNVMEWAGLRYQDPVVHPKGSPDATLSYTNDVRGLPFKEIADLIEKDL